MDQLGLDFAATHSRRTDPTTSKRAASSMAVASEAQREAIYWSLVRAGGQSLTADEIALREGMTLEQVCRRLPDLEKDGRVEPTGETRPTRSGRAARCWRLRKVGGM